MKFWTTNIATLLVASFCTADTDELGRYYRSRLLDRYDEELLSMFDVDIDSEEIDRFLAIGGVSMSLAPIARVTGVSEDGKESKSNKDAQLRKVSKNKSVKKDKKSSKSPKEGKKKSKEGEETKTIEKKLVTKKDKGRRVLGIGLSEPERSGKDGKQSKKAKLGKKEKKESKRDTNKLVLPSTKEGKPNWVPNKKFTSTRSMGGVPNKKLTPTRSKAGSKGSSSEKGKVKSGSRDGSKGPSDTGKAKAGSKVSSKTGPKASSSENHEVEGGTERISSGKVKAASPISKTGTKGKVDSKRYRARRRAQATEKDIVWKSDRRELGDHCTINSVSARTSAGQSQSASKSGSKEGGKSGSKEGGKSGSKEGGKSGSKGGAERRDRGRRRTEIGLFACNLDGTYTCCKEYGDMGDDKVCCKGDYMGSVDGRQDDQLFAQKALGKQQSKGSFSTKKRSGVSSSRGSDDVNPSHSNDFPLAVNAPGFGAPPLARPQDPATMRVEHRWQNSDYNMK